MKNRIFLPNRFIDEGPNKQCEEMCPPECSTVAYKISAFDFRLPNSDYDAGFIELNIYYKRLKGDLDLLKIDIKTWDNVTMEADQQSSIISRIMDDLRNELTGNKHFVLESDISGIKAGLQGVKVVHQAKVEAVVSEFIH